MTSLTSVSAIFFGYVSSGKDNIKIKEWDYMKLKSFCTVKEISNKMTRQPTECEKIFANDIPNKGSIKIYEDLIQLNIQKTSHLKNG